MFQKQDLGRLLDYTEWANDRCLRAAATLAIEDFRRDLGSSHGGVRGTLSHMLGAEWLWLERWKGVSPAGMLDEPELGDAAALQARWQALEQQRRAWFEGLEETAVTSPLHYKTTTGIPYTASLWQLVQHMANHATYHRGQVVTMLRQLQATPLATDLLAWDRERDASKGPR